MTDDSGGTSDDEHPVWKGDIPIVPVPDPGGGLGGHNDHGDGPDP